jgi:hypothetical protein
MEPAGTVAIDGDRQVALRAVVEEGALAGR